MIRRHTRFARTLAAMLLAVVLGVSAMASERATSIPPVELPISEALVALASGGVAPSSVSVLDPVALPSPAWTSTAPTPRLASAPVSAAAAVNASFFGPGVTVKTYTVTGATPAAIVRSVQARGPYSPWLRGRAEAVTQSKRIYQFSLSESLVEVTPGTWSGQGCQIRQEANPAITQTYTVLMPKWTPPRGASTATIRWWTAELLRVATHERTHVQNGITATKAANLVLASSTCANAESRLNAVWLDQQRHDCEFDMREYGKAAGLTLKSCTSQ